MKADDGSRQLDELLVAVRGCRVCETHLPLGPRPLVQMGRGARILIVGQAPGARAHASGIPWADRSGERLRGWMGIDSERFYDPDRIAIVVAQLPQVELTLWIGRHAQRHGLPGAWPAAAGSLTSTTRQWRQHAPRVVPLPHPSARNIAWFKANPWFEVELVPALRQRVRDVLGGAPSGSSRPG